MSIQPATAGAAGDAANAGFPATCQPWAWAALPETWEAASGAAAHEDTLPGGSGDGRTFDCPGESPGLR